VKKQAFGMMPSHVPGPAGPSAAVAAVLEGTGILMGSSVDEHHLIHKPAKMGLAASDITGAMAVADAMHFGGAVNGQSPSLVRRVTAACVAVWRTQQLGGQGS
jgi:N-acetylglucosamine-6-phosphate deacetylase